MPGAFEFIWWVIKVIVLIAILLAVGKFLLITGALVLLDFLK